MIKFLEVEGQLVNLENVTRVMPSGDLGKCRILFNDGRSLDLIRASYEEVRDMLVSL